MHFTVKLLRQTSICLQKHHLQIDDEQHQLSIVKAISSEQRHLTMCPLQVVMKKSPCSGINDAVCSVVFNI